MATCATPSLVTISPNIRLCRHKSVAVDRGVALVKPDDPCFVKVSNFGPDQAIVRTNSILGFAEAFQGPMLAAITDDKATQDTPTGDDTSSSDDPVEDVDLSEAPEHLHKQIRAILRTHSAMWDGTLGTIHATEHAMVTPANAVPIRAQQYRTGPFKRQIIADQINKMLKLKVIEPSHSAWASPVVIVLKKNGKARFCVDYRRLNNITKKDAYPLPRMEDCLNSLGDAKVFTLSGLYGRLMESAPTPCRQREDCVYNACGYIPLAVHALWTDQRTRYVSTCPRHYIVWTQFAALPRLPR